MNNLILKGKAEVEGMSFTHIEGGFGEGKKSMLAKDIANMHGRTLDEVNRSINRNRKRFKNKVDVIDLKDANFVPHLVSNGIYTQNAINRSSNIYLLSERGYSKLLKILEDDFAWEQYDKLVDGYFNMREAIGKDVPKLDSNFLFQIAAKIEEQEKEIGVLQLATKKQEQVIGELKPKADYMDNILQNKGLVTITQIAHDYGISGQAMNNLLHELGVQYKQSQQWLLYAKHQGKGYTHSKTIDIVRSDGTPDIKMNTKWTQKGRLFLYELLKENEYLPTIEKDFPKKQMQG